MGDYTELDDFWGFDWEPDSNQILNENLKDDYYNNDDGLIDACPERNWDCIENYIYHTNNDDYYNDYWDNYNHNNYWDDYYVDDRDDENLVFLAPLLVFAAVFMFCLLLRYHKHNNYRSSNTTATINTNNNTNNSNNNTTARAQNVNRTPQEDGKSSLLSMELLKELYGAAFQHNQNQALLEASRILAKEDHGDEENQCIPCGGGNSGPQGTDPSIARALESARSTRQSMGDKNQDDDTADDDSSVIGSAENHPSIAQSTVIHPRLPVDHNRNDVYDNTIRGNCVICFEDFQPGEMVVWSMNENCPHIYHKDCMVKFLATKHSDMLKLRWERGQQPKPQSNPCPTCRLPFVTVDALDITGTTTSSNNNNTSNNSTNNNASQTAFSGALLYRGVVSLW